MDVPINLPDAGRKDILAFPDLRNLGDHHDLLLFFFVKEEMRSLPMSEKAGADSLT